MHFQSGFLGREHEANCYRQIGSIRPDAHLKFPAYCYILGDCIYSNGYPFIPPYKVTDIICQTRAVNVQGGSSTGYIGDKDYLLEIKTLKIIGSVYRHPRWN